MNNKLALLALSLGLVLSTKPMKKNNDIHRRCMNLCIFFNNHYDPPTRSLLWYKSSEIALDIEAIDYDENEFTTHHLPYMKSFLKKHPSQGPLHYLLDFETFGKTLGEHKKDMLEELQATEYLLEYINAVFNYHKSQKQLNLPIKKRKTHTVPTEPRLLCPYINCKNTYGHGYKHKRSLERHLQLYHKNDIKLARREHH